MLLEEGVVVLVRVGDMVLLPVSEAEGEMRKQELREDEPSGDVNPCGQAVQEALGPDA